MDSICLPLALKVVFAVDHDLVVTMSKQDDDGVAQLQLTFSKFTTGVPHPLSAPTHTISLPAASGFDFADMNMEVLGDHVLTSVRRQSGQASFYLVSWKTGSVTLVSGSQQTSRVVRQVDTPVGRRAEAGGHRRRPDRADKGQHEQPRGLQARDRGTGPGGPRLHTICFLELPPLAADASGVVSAAIREWVPTSRHHHHHHQHAASVESSRRRHVPFYSSAVGTMALSLDYRTYEKGAGYPFRCTMIISVVALLAAVRSRSSSDARDEVDDGLCPGRTGAPPGRACSRGRC
ncbi:hypothetical protein BC826DRAFT_286195 [Russula brevipes]|nr:hypothetical protein BC826DRAFT_286195 [Russula brevipes]